MSKETWQAGKLKRVFERTGTGELTPNNFGKVLLAAIDAGVCSERRVARLLNTDVTSIRKAGNNLKPRQIASISRDLIRE